MAGIRKKIAKTLGKFIVGRSNNNAEDIMGGFPKISKTNNIKIKV